MLRIVEQRDATADERAINEINTSIYAFRRDLLGPALRHLSPDNSQGEYYLTDVVSVLAGMGHRIGSVQAPAGGDAGRQRPLAAGARRARAARPHQPHWLLNGVTMLDPRQTFIDVTVQLGRDVTLYPGHDPAGPHGHRRRLRDRPRHPPRRLRRRRRTASIENTVGRDAEVGAGAHVGPYAHLPSGSSVAAGVRRPARSTLHRST